MAQDQGTYPGLCLLTDSDGKVITIEDSVSHDTVVFTHTNTGEGEFAICYPEVLGSGVPEAALADFGTHNVENTATQGYAFTLGDEEYLVRQNVIAPTPGEINDVLYSRSLVVDNNTIDVLVTEDGSVVSYFDGQYDICFAKSTNGEWHAEQPYYDQIVEASGAADSVSIGCTVADGVYTIKYGFNTYIMTEDSLTPEVAEWVNPRSEAILYAKEYVSGQFVLADNFGRGLRFETTQGSYSFIELDKQGDDWDFSQTVSSIGSLPSVDIESEWTESYTKVEFTLGGTTYNANTMKIEDPSWITPNNIVEFK